MHRTENRPLPTGAITPARGAGLRRRAHRRLDHAARPLRPRRWPPRSPPARSSTTPCSTRWCSSGAPVAPPSSAGCPAPRRCSSAGPRSPARWPGRPGLLRRRLLLADAALLGPGHALPRRLRPRRRADAAGGHQRAQRRPPDRSPGPGRRSRSRCCCGRWPPATARLALHGRRRRAWAPGSSPRRTGCSAGSARRRDPADAAVPRVDLLHGALPAAIVVDVLV